MVVKKTPKCSICRQTPVSTCDWRQGRCPHLPPVLQLTIIDKLVNFFKGKHEQPSRSSKTQKHKSSKKRT
jgi:hypothetical protein